MPALIFGLIFGLLFIMIDAGKSKACDPTGSIRGPGITVDPASLPKSISVAGGWNLDQVKEAATIVIAVKEKGGDAYAQQLVVTAAMAESSLTNVNHGDAVRNDTIGLFQQGPETGSYQDRMDPTKATYIFYARMVARNPDLHAKEPTLTLNKTQGNQDPYYYRPFWTQAGDMLQKLAGAKKANGDTTAQPAAQSASTSSSSTRVVGPGKAMIDTTSKWRLGPTKPHTLAVANTLGDMFHLKTIGGWRDPKIEKIEPYGHPAGNALDLMINDVGGLATGDKMADYIVAHYQELGVRHLIYRQRIWVAAKAAHGWTPMEDRGSPTANHMDHIHLNLQGDPAALAADGSTTGDAGAGPAACPGATSGATDTSQVNAQGWAMPIKGATWVSDFGPRGSPGGVGSTYHRGDDLAAACNTPIFAAHDGVIAQVRFGDPGGGSIITLDHGDGHTRSEYLHMYPSGVLVEQGATVKAGQQIGKVGSAGHSTGCHLHFQVLVDGTLTDPMPIVKKAGLDFGPYKGS